MRTTMSLQKLTLILEDQPTYSETINKMVESALASYKWAYPNEGDHDVLVSLVFPVRYVGKT